MTKRFLRAQDIPVLLDLPDVRQATSYNCGPSVVRAVLGYYGVDRREDVIAAAVKSTPADGTPPDRLARYLRQAGLKVTSAAMTVAKLERYLDRGIPVIVAFQAWTEQKRVRWADDWADGHYAVVIGYDAEHLVFEDPSLLGRGFLTKKEFEERWHDVDAPGRPYRNLGLAVSGHRPKFDRDRILPIK